MNQTKFDDPVTLTYVSGAGTDTRTYKAVEGDGFTFTITVKGLLRGA